MTEHGDMIIETFKPSDELVQAVESYKATFGLQTLDIAYRLKIIEENLQHVQKPHLFCQLLKCFLSTISSEDPTQLHFDIARRALLQIDEVALKNEQAVDMLAREFLKTCNKLNKLIQLPRFIVELISDGEKAALEIDRGPACLNYIDFPNASAEFEEQFFTNGLAKWDEIYLKVLSSCGSTGREQAKEQRKKLKESEKLYAFCSIHLVFP